MIGCITQEAIQRQNAAIVAKASGPLAAAHGVTLTSDTSGAPLACSFHDHAAGMTVEVQQAGYAEAADRGAALQQMGQRRPSGMAGQPAEATAPTGVGARFRQNAPQAASHGGAVYLPGMIGGAFG